jgi:deoxyribodipyrimidine photo-lyase
MAPLKQEMLNLQIGETYPHPVADHATQRKLALALYKSAGEHAEES